MRGSLIRKIELLWITVHTREFNLSHLLNPRDTNRKKLCASLIWCASM